MNGGASSPGAPQAAAPQRAAAGQAAAGNGPRQPGQPGASAPGTPLAFPTSPFPYPRLIAHRGGGAGHRGTAPENTLAGLAAAHAAGYRGVEVDVMLSADGVAFLHHDDTLERTTDGRGPVASTPAAQLERLDAGAWRDPAFAGERLPQLTAALDRCQALGLWLNLEIKPTPGRDAATAQAVAERLAARWPALAAPEAAHALPPLVISSFSTVALGEIARRLPAAPRALLAERLPPDWRDLVDALGCAALHLNAARLDAGTVAALRTAAPGLVLAAYTVNEPAAMAALFAAGIDALFTDRIDLSPAHLLPPAP